MGGSPLLKRLLPLVGIAVVLVLWRLRRARAGPRPDAAGTLESELVFDPRGPVLGIDPGLSRCGYGAVAGRGARHATPSRTA